MSALPPVALTVAGSDSSGGAGIEADLRTFAWHGCHGAAVLTAITAQNTVGVRGAWPLPPATIIAQFSAVADDLDVRALKTGMLADAATIAAVATGLRQIGAAHVVVDPVMVATSGDRLLAPDAVEALSELWPLATLITPNLPEAEVLLGSVIAPDHKAREAAARELARRTGAAVLLKGGHAPHDADDCLVSGSHTLWLRAPRVPGGSLHGTGCHLSAAVTARLAHGADLPTAVGDAVAWLRSGIAGAVALGAGARTLWPPYVPFAGSEAED